jgi:hypothetical protein
MNLADRRCGAKYLEEVLAMSERRACRSVGIAHSTKRRSSGRIKEVGPAAKVHEISERHPRFGHRKIFHRLQTAGWRVGRERVRLPREGTP